MSDFYQDLLPQDKAWSGLGSLEKNLLEHKIENATENHWRWFVATTSELRFASAAQDRILRLEFSFPHKAKDLTIKYLGQEQKCGQRVAIKIPAQAEFLLRCEFLPEQAVKVEGDERTLFALLTKAELFRQDFLESKICPMPFTRREINSRNSFVPCCEPWLTQEFRQIPIGEDPWNGPAAQALRSSMYDGSYRYCHREICHTQYFSREELSELQDTTGEFYFSPAVLKATQAGQTEMPEAPSAFTLSADPRCNLQCPSCRSAPIFSLKPAEELMVEKELEALQKAKSEIVRLRIAGDGEALFSPSYRKLIQSLRDFPQLKIVELHTNGLLLQEKNLQELRPGSDKINRVLVSIDAANAEEYAKIRGGDWARLLANLGWLSEQRKRGRFEHFSLLFVFRKANFRSMPDFYALGERLGADEVCFSPFLPWGRMGIKDYEIEAVHRPENSLYNEYKSLRRSLAGRKVPRLLWGIPEE